MNTFATAAALTLLATTMALAAETKERPHAESRSAPHASFSSHQYLEPAVSGPDTDARAETGTGSCRPKRKAIKDAAAATAFAATAAQDGVVEVALAGLVLRKSGDHQLRQFAQKVLQDYAQSNGSLDSIAKCEGLTLPIELDTKHNAVINRLDAKSGGAFEAAYLEHMAGKHSDPLPLFVSASTSGDHHIAAFARKVLSILREHQLLADNLRATIGARVANTHQNVESISSE